MVGDSFYSVALIVAVLQSTHSVTSGAMVLIAGTIPIILFTLIGGTVSDRFPRNRVMLSSDFVRSATQFVMAALLLRSAPPLWALIVTQFCYGVGDAFFDPASTGLLPQLVEPDDLPAANSALQLVANSAIMAGPALAGIVITTAGAPAAVACDAVSFVASGISLCFLRVPKARLALARDSMIAQLRNGFAEMRKRRWALVTAGYLAVLAFAFNGPIFVLGPAAALGRLGGPWVWSLMLSVFGIGLIVGSVAALRLVRTTYALGWAYLGNLAIVPLLVLLGTSHAAWLIIAASGIAGLAISMFSVTYPTLLQQTIPNEILSRVSSYFWLARVAAMPLALALVGPISTRFGIAAVFDGAALVVCAATIASAAVPDIWLVRAVAGD